MNRKTRPLPAGCLSRSTRRVENPQKKQVGDDPISKDIAKVLKTLGFHRPGLGFYALRHTFETIGQKTP